MTLARLLVALALFVLPASSFIPHARSHHVRTTHRLMATETELMKERLRAVLLGDRAAPPMEEAKKEPALETEAKAKPAKKGKKGKKKPMEEAKDEPAPETEAKAKPAKKGKKGKNKNTTAKAKAKPAAKAPKHSPYAMPEKLGEWGMDDKLWNAVPLGAHKDLTRYVEVNSDRYDKMAQDRIVFLKDVASYTSDKGEGAWERAKWDEAMKAWSENEAQAGEDDVMKGKRFVSRKE